MTTCPGCGSSLFDGEKCGACGRPASDTTPRPGSRQALGEPGPLIGCAATIMLAAVVVLWRFRADIWGDGNEPGWLRWALYTAGALILAGKLFLLIAGTRGERIYALVFLLVVTLLVVTSSYF